MTEKVLLKGNIAIAQAALDCGCTCYFGYPITPQTEIGEFLSLEMQKKDLAYVCAESEVAAINMALGAASVGAKVMTSSSSCAVGLMQEALSYIASDELPVVLINVMRAGPGQGYIYPSQGDYNQATISGANGDVKMIVLAPATVQECVDLTYKAFHLAHKYRTPTILLADGLLGQMMEPVEFKKYPYPEIDQSSWALTGAKNRSGRVLASLGVDVNKQCEHINHLFEKYKQIEENETEWEEFYTDDAEIILISFGSPSRGVKSAVKELRKEGMKVGFFRPITLFPFPNQRLAQLAEKSKKFIVVEINMGQMIRDVKLASNGKIDVELINKPVGAPIDVETLINEIKRMQ